MQPIFSEQEKDSTAYFFVRLKAVYGAEFMRHFPDVESERISKREWARQIGQYSREQIDGMFSHVKSERMRGNDDYQWLDIGNILAILGSSWQHARQSQSVDEALGREPHKAIENMTGREKKREINKQRMAAMRAELGI